jgi:predicted DNA-binding antitoxin AbrB/MazE fold protein
MTQVDAIYHAGVFQPLEDVRLAENQRVRLRIEPLEGDETREWREWLTRVQQRQQRIIAECGFLPDSTPDIAEDRRR